MKRLLIGSLITAFLMASAPVMADDDRRGQGWQKHHERGKAVPPGHQKKFLQAHYRDDRYNRHHHKPRHYKQHKWDRKHHDRHRYLATSAIGARSISAMSTATGTTAGVTGIANIQAITASNWATVTDCRRRPGLVGSFTTLTC